ncbi:DUF3006 domain-containing protein [Natronomonas pharaonis]|nr:DUF3006 domain-containing protein [Natronomonas pharaonis]
MRTATALCVVALLSTALLSGVAAAEADQTAVVDRIGDDYAVMLIEEDGETVDQAVVDPETLPDEGRYEGAIYQVVDGEYVYDGEESDDRDSRLGELLEALSERLS